MSRSGERTGGSWHYVVSIAIAGLLLVSCTTTAATDSTEPTQDLDAQVVAAIEVGNQLCPVIQTWAEDIAGIMNGLSTFGIAEPDPTVRNAHYLERLLAITERNAEYDQQLAVLPSGPLMDELVGQIRSGLVRSVGQLEDMAYSVKNRPDLDEVRPQIRISGLFVAAEKVVIFGKPRLGRIEDSHAAAVGLQQVDECERAIMDLVGRSEEIEAVGEPIG